MATTPDPTILAFECADRINRLPEQLSALFQKGESAQERLDSISTATLKIRVGIEIVTNYIERNQPHLLDSHMQRIATILGNVEKCAAREGSEEPRKTIAVLIVVAHRVAIWLRGWAEEQRTNQGQTRERLTLPAPAGSSKSGAPTDAEAEKVLTLSAQDWASRYKLTANEKNALEARLRRKRMKDPDGNWFQEVTLPKKNESSFVYRGHVVLLEIEELKNSA